MATKDEKKHLDAVAALPCIVCGTVPVELHHTVRLAKKKRDHMEVLPLCKNHHTGVFSIHMARKSFRAQYGQEEELLSQVERMLELQRSITR